MYKEIFCRLPFNYSGEGQVNNENYYRIVYSEFEALIEVLEDIRLSKDIDNAYGRSLDYLGFNVQELRESDDDEIYRQFIKTKIIANMSNGGIETINQVGNILIGDGFLGATEAWKSALYDNEPAALVLKMRNQGNSLPFNAIDRVIAGGVGTKWILEFKQEDSSEIYVGMATLSGEEITIYPYLISQLGVKSKVFIGTGHNVSTEEVNVYPGREVS